MVSAIVLTKNEEKNIGACLASLSWCEEIIVIDDDSTDKTVDIAKKAGAKIYLRSLDQDFAAQRNYGLEKASQDWVLFIDADERVSDQLAYEIQSLILQTTFQGFYTYRKDTMWGKTLEHGETGVIKLLRLGKKKSGKWVGKVHERWEISGKVGVCAHPLNHYPHPSVKDFLEKMQIYTDLRALELYEKKVKVYWWHIILYPKAKFFLNYIIRLGFLDGAAGMVHAIMMSLHSFLVRGKLWTLYRKKLV
jgi:glycosyltransferase involved in cell wall biosynthesis